MFTRGEPRMPLHTEVRVPRSVFQLFTAVECKPIFTQNRGVYVITGYILLLGIQRDEISVYSVVVAVQAGVSDCGLTSHADRRGERNTCPVHCRLRVREMGVQVRWHQLSCRIRSADPTCHLSLPAQLASRINNSVSCMMDVDDPSWPIRCTSAR